MAKSKTKQINEEAVEWLADRCRERLDEMLPDLLKYVNASKAKGSIKLSIDIDPVKDTPGAYYVDVQPSISAKGMRAEAPASIERVGSQLQLRLAL